MHGCVARNRVPSDLTRLTISEPKGGKIAKGWRGCEIFSVQSGVVQPVLSRGSAHQRGSRSRYA